MGAQNVQIDTGKIKVKKETATADRNLKPLEATSPEMRKQLAKLIDSTAAYFIITGSDARDLTGCCPSDNVTAANKLVEAGILQVARNTTPPGTCPVSFYAFAGEISEQGERPEFITNRELRRRVRDYLQRLETRKSQIWPPILRWLLLIFIVVSLIFMIVRPRPEMHPPYSSIADPLFLTSLEIPPNARLLVLLLHRSQRCEFCLNMEDFAGQTLEKFHADELREQKIVFRTLNMDSPQYAAIIEKQDLFTGSIMLIAIEDGRIKRRGIFKEAWYLTDNKNRFSAAFEPFIRDFYRNRR